MFSNFTSPCFYPSSSATGLAFLCFQLFWPSGPPHSLPAPWCCTSQRPGANNLMSMFLVEVSPSPCWRRKSLSWWMKILSKLQCHVPGRNHMSKHMKLLKNLSEMGFVIGTCVISHVRVWGRKSWSCYIRETLTLIGYDHALCYCQSA